MCKDQEVDIFLQGIGICRKSLMAPILTSLSKPDLKHLCCWWRGRESMEIEADRINTLSLKVAGC